jgi:ABC-type branched-subunit amino acid transport system substrate-binding protein
VLAPIMLRFDLGPNTAPFQRTSVQPDVIFHTGYNPDITLFLGQARELGLKFSTLIGHGAGSTPTPF